MRILGVDPGFANCGWAVIEDGAILDCGVIVTTVKEEHDARLRHIYEDLALIIRDYRVTCIANERLPYNSKMQGTSNIVEVIGLLGLLAAKVGVRRVEYSPMTCKKSMTGFGNANKEDVMRFIRSLGWDGKLVEHSADAALTALTHEKMFNGYT